LFQDPSQSFRANLGSDDEFVGGIQGKLGKMGLEYVKDMYLEHNCTHDAKREFTANNAGHVLKTTAKREWEFVVGSHGVDLVKWTFDLEHAEPERPGCVLRKSSLYASILAPSTIDTTVCCVGLPPPGTRCSKQRST